MSSNKVSNITSLNSNLHKAKSQKKDEFYTQLTDIEKELKNYKKVFKGKVVYCNCDDPRISNFFHYFSHNFEVLGLKKLITTCYKNDNMNSFSKNKSSRAIYLEYHGNSNNVVPDQKDIRINYLEGDGDFRSQESIEILKTADIVVTNPPFSLFREYITQLIEYKKKFLVIGDQNAITYKEIFQLIKDNKIWLGYDNGGTKWFQVPNDYDIKTNSRKKIENGIKYFSKGSITWYTNIDTTKRHEDLILYKKYKPSEYVKYENFNAINIDKTTNIPVDYKGYMGVPITFIDKYNPEQFEILGLGISSSGIDIGVKPYKSEHKYYRRHVEKKGAVDGDLYMINKGIVKVPYARILIKNKKL